MTRADGLNSLLFVPSSTGATFKQARELQRIAVRTGHGSFDAYGLEGDLPAELDIKAIRWAGRAYRGIFTGQGVRLAPDVAAVFNPSAVANEALRTLTQVMHAVNSDSEAA